MEIDKAVCDLTPVLEFMKQLQKEKEEQLVAAVAAREQLERRPRHRSVTINELATALAKAQSEMPTANKKSENPYFKSSYADLAEIVSVSRPALTKHGLSIVQQLITNGGGATILHTIMLHSSGEWIESTMLVVPPKNDIHSISSYITYLKRIHYAALVGVVTADEDDDGNKAVAPVRETR